MKNTIKIIALALAVICTLCVVASCGAKKKTITVGYTIYAPMNYNDENGELVGFDTELAKAVFEDLGYNVLFKEIVWEQKYTELESGTINCIWNGFTNGYEDDGTPRTDYVDFSYNYMINKQVVVAKKDSGIAAASDLSGKVGSAEKGSIGYEYLGGFEGAITKDATSQLSALQDMKMGGCEFVVLDEQLAKAYVGQGEYTDYEIVDALSSDIEYYAIGFKKGSDLTAKVNATLEKFAANGKLMEIASHYGAQTAIVTDYTDQK